MKLEKNIFLFAALIGLAVSVAIPAVPTSPLQPYPSDYTHEPWAYQVVPTPNAQTVTYAVSDDPRCKTACYKGEFCKIIRGNAVCTPYCGDGIVARGEEVNGACDDGNQNPFDGCNKCKVTRNWFCGNKRDTVTKQPIIGAVSVCSWLCGDGKVDTVTGEQCDDGNNINGDGCSSLCRIVPSWSCPLPASGSRSVCTPKCGDGRRVSYELDEGKCDDGNNNDNDGCSATCVVEKHWACRGVPSICTPSCPSAEWNAYAQEQCDNGQVIDGNGAVIPDGCDQSDNKCVPNSGWTCTNIAGRPSVCKTKCGDGILAGNQECDDNNLVNGDGCNRQCKIQLGWKCPIAAATPNATSVCQQICGDGRRVGKQALPRGCDDANDDTTDGCVGCQTQRLFTCVNLFPNTPSKCENLCGNGRFNPIVGEECDTGAATGVGCQSDCTVTAGWTCEIGAAYGPTPCHKCGNSIVEVTETCDIGGEDVGCVGCVLQAGYTCTDTACTSTAP